ncbi:MAG: AAA family ATPase [Gammaproteobacteria bacterium]|nr:AAA family ATPase [Gammaproteobacteria bacterium]
MYLENFNLQEMPFSITPDTQFFFNQSCHQEGLNVLLISLRSGEGFIKITGEVGTGKTLLCRKLLNEIEDEFVTAYIPNPFMSSRALYLGVAEELGVQGKNVAEHQLVKLITKRLIEIRAQGKKAVLCIDEAQAMPLGTLEAVRLLTNLETEKSKLLQVVIFGQPELDERLSHPSVRQLKQRISFSYSLTPLNKRNVKNYIHHRMSVAGYRGKPIISSSGVRELYRASRGVPRLINIICNKALLSAYGQGKHEIRKKHITRAINDTESTAPRRRIVSNVWWFGLVTGAGIIAIGYNFYASQLINIVQRFVQ